MCATLNNSRAHSGHTAHSRGARREKRACPARCRRQRAILDAETSWAPCAGSTCAFTRAENRQNGQNVRARSARASVPDEDNRTMHVRPMTVIVGQPGRGLGSSVHGSSAQRHVDTHAACAGECVRVTRPHRHCSKASLMLLPMVPLVWCWHDPAVGGCAVRRRKFLAKQACTCLHQMGKTRTEQARRVKNFRPSVFHHHHPVAPPLGVSGAVWFLIHL
mmetsp:Transcript_24334/g.76361  ORF Transcript_24334/g.76361 Transcript_24334/m.76361 type:complete len:219 (+) Transcript_24334:333-989(+)